MGEITRVLVLDDSIIKIRNMVAEHEKLIVELRSIDKVYEDAYSELQKVQEKVRLHSAYIEKYIGTVFLSNSIRELGVSIKTSFKSEDCSELVDGISFGEKK